MFQVNTTKDTIGKTAQSFFLFCLLIFLASCSSDTLPGSATISSEKSNNPIHESTIDLIEYRGKKLLIVFWATWCKPCKDEAPTLVKIHNKYAGDNFAILGISVDHNKKTAQRFIDKLGINFPVYMTAKSDEELFGPIFGVPTILFVDQKGKVINKHMGALPPKALLKAAETFIEKS